MIDLIAGLEPDLVVMDAEENRREDYDALLGLGLCIHTLQIQSIHDVNASMAELADRVGAQWQRLELPHDSQIRAQAFIPIWRNPWIALGSPSYGSSLLALLGVVNIFASKGQYPEVTLDEAASLSPDVVVAPSEPYPFSKRQLPELTQVAPTVFVDGQDLFWWGTRSAAALARLALELSDVGR